MDPWSFPTWRRHNSPESYFNSGFAAAGVVLAPAGEPFLHEYHEFLVGHGGGFGRGVERRKINGANIHVRSVPIRLITKEQNARLRKVDVGTPGTSWTAAGSGAPRRFCTLETAVAAALCQRSPRRSIPSPSDFPFSSANQISMVHSTALET